MIKLNDAQKQAIINEYETFKEIMYAGKSYEERQELGQFFTPPEITFKMIEQYDSFNETDILLDPCMGAGGLLTACIVAGLVKPDNVLGIELDWDIYNIAKERLTKLGVPKNRFYERAPYNTTGSKEEVEKAKLDYFEKSVLTTRRPEKGKHFFCGNALNKNSYKFTEEEITTEAVVELDNGMVSFNWWDI